jgi:hypothetical protein
MRWKAGVWIRILSRWQYFLGTSFLIGCRISPRATENYEKIDGYTEKDSVFRPAVIKIDAMTSSQLIYLSVEAMTPS